MDFGDFARISGVWYKSAFLHVFVYTPGLGAKPTNLVYSRSRVKKQTWTIHQKALEIFEIPVGITRPPCWCILGSALYLVWIGVVRFLQRKTHTEPKVLRISSIAFLMVSFYWCGNRTLLLEKDFGVGAQMTTFRPQMDRNCGVLTDGAQEHKLQCPTKWSEIGPKFINGRKPMHN